MSTLIADCLPDAPRSLTVITPRTLPEALLATASALGWAHDHERPLNLAWQVNEALPDLFQLPKNTLNLLPEPSPAAHLLNHYLENRLKMPNERRYAFEHYFDHLLVRDTAHEQARLREISTNPDLGRVLVHQSGLFYRRPRFDDFKPSAKIKHHIQRLNKDYQLSNMLGVCLHTLDGAPPADDLAAVEALLTESKLNCFLVTHTTAGRALRRQFGKRIVEPPYTPELNATEFSVFSLFALSRTLRLYGNFTADWGRLAAAIGKRHFKLLTPPDTRHYHIVDEKLPELWRHWAYWPISLPA